MGRINIWINVSDYERMLFGESIAIEISETQIVELSLKHTIDKKKLTVKYYDEDGNLTSGRKI